VAELRFEVMGVRAHVIVATDEPGAAVALLDRAHRRLEELDQQWSRFLPGSDIGRLNRAPGEAVRVGTETADLVELAVAGWRATGGLFDPTVLPALRAAGYDEAFGHDAGVVPAAAARAGRAAPGCAGISVDRRAGTVCLPVGTELDPGGIGKGFAADLVTTELRDAGADAVCVNLAGDLRVDGNVPERPGWIIEIEDPRAVDDTVVPPLGRLRVDSGAVASSSRLKRAWGPPAARRHHIIDPRSGLPADSGLVGVTVIAGAGWWAEVLATAAFLAGADEGARLVERHDAAALLVGDDDAVHGAGPIDAFLV